MRPVSGETIGGGEGDDCDPCVSEVVEMIAHGDHVFLAGQSSEMPVQDQHDRPTPHLGSAPRPSIVVDELDVRERVTDGEGHLASPVLRLARYHGRRVDFGGPPGVPASVRT